MATRIINDSKLNDIAVAIQAKDSGGQMTVEQMAQRIEALPEIVDEEAALVLIDWEGTLLRSYTRDEAMALTALPNPSTLPNYAYADHEWLVFQEWNWSLVNIKAWIQAHEGETLEVGAIYTTTDGQDHNYWNNPRLDTATTINIQKRGTVSIGNNAFYNCTSLAAINIPDGVTSIGGSAFGSCYSLVAINIPDGVTSIGNNAFQNCTSLVAINIPDGVTSIGNNAFQNCTSLAAINIPDGVTSIGGSAFYNCTSLAAINIPDGVTSIGGSAFRYCYSLTSINIPDGVTSIGDHAFYNCVSLCDILLESKPTLVNTNVFVNLPTNYRNYVPRANLSWFETATNWSTIYTQGHIVAIEDYIAYLESIGFNVDKYKEATV